MSIEFLQHINNSLVDSVVSLEIGNHDKQHVDEIIKEGEIRLIIQWDNVTFPWILNKFPDDLSLESAKDIVNKTRNYTVVS